LWWEEIKNNMTLTPSIWLFDSIGNGDRKLAGSGVRWHSGEAAHTTNPHVSNNIKLSIPRFFFFPILLWLIFGEKKLNPWS
jgi:hypothetical protein